MSKKLEMLEKMYDVRSIDDLKNNKERMIEIIVEYVNTYRETLSGIKDECEGSDEINEENFRKVFEIVTILKEFDPALMDIFDRLYTLQGAEDEIESFQNDIQKVRDNEFNVLWGIIGEMEGLLEKAFAKYGAPVEDAPEEADTSQKMIYQMTLLSGGCRVHAELNGYPIYDIDTTKTRVENTIPLNIALIGKDNVLKLKVEGTSETDETVLKGSVRIDEMGTIPGADSGVVLKEFDLSRAPSSDRIEEGLEIRFDNEDIDFRSRLLEGEPTEDEDSLKQYAHGLKELFMKKEIDAICTEFQPKMDDYSKAFYTPKDQSESMFKDYMESSFFKSELLDFQIEDLKLVPWCGKRIWEIRKNDDTELFRTKEDESGTQFIPIYIGKVDGELKVIR